MRPTPRYPVHTFKTDHERRHDLENFLFIAAVVAGTVICTLIATQL